ncbi:superoxide dismutase [bacterium]|nr:superoxide dismutase [bacterium]
MNFSRITLKILVVIAVLGFTAPFAFSHCEIPCGIYTDQMRFDMMNEDLQTVEKSINSIVEISAQDSPNYNQLVRWVNNKETHSDKISDVISQYFLKQRVKPADMNDKEAYEKYITQLTLCHEIMVTSMKCKQSTDLENVEKLKSLLKEFHKAYFGEEGSHHH